MFKDDIQSAANCVQPGISRKNLQEQKLRIPLQQES